MAAPPLTRPARWLIPRLYGPLAWAYDPLVWVISAGQWYRWVETVERFIADEPVLEVGCGRGRLLERLIGQGRQALAVDRSWPMVQATRRRLRRGGLKGRVLRADARFLPLPDGAIGSLVQTFPGGYVGEEGVQREFARVLRPGGQWILARGLVWHGRSLGSIGLRATAAFEYGLRRRTTSAGEGLISRHVFPEQHIETVNVGPVGVVIMRLIRP